MGTWSRRPILEEESPWLPTLPHLRLRVRLLHRAGTHARCSTRGCGRIGSGSRGSMCTCCCRVARARWLQVRHSSRLYAFLPGSTPSLPPCHAPRKLGGLRGAGAAQQVRAPELLREGRGRLQARLANREALVDRHACLFREVLACRRVGGREPDRAWAASLTRGFRPPTPFGEWIREIRRSGRGQRGPRLFA